MVEISVDYEGELHCRAEHGPSGNTLGTDAPVDNRGKGETFSPTDLVATSLGTCIATILGMRADDQGWDLRGMRVQVGKEMTNSGRRRVACLTVDIHMPVNLPEKERAVAARVPETCPVTASLHPEIDIPVVFHWPDK